MSERSREALSVEEFQQATLLSAVARTVIAPFDRMKFLLQCQGELHRLGKLEKPYGGMLPCLHRVVGLEGVGSLWRGNIISCTSVMPTMLAQAYICIPVQRGVFDTLPHSSAVSFTVASILSGMVGGFVGSLISYPMDFARFRLACDVKPHLGGRYDYRHSLSFFSHHNIADNPHLMYRGLSLHLGGSYLNFSLYYSVFNLISPWLQVPEDGHTTWRTAAMQASASMVVTNLVVIWLYPVDTVRRRMMLAVNHEGFEYRSAQHCFRIIMRCEGAWGLYRGAGFGVVRLAASALVSMALGV